MRTRINYSSLHRKRCRSTSIHACSPPLLSFALRCLHSNPAYDPLRVIYPLASPLRLPPSFHHNYSLAHTISLSLAALALIIGRPLFCTLCHHHQCCHCLRHESPSACYPGYCTPLIRHHRRPHVVYALLNDTWRDRRNILQTRLPVCHIRRSVIQSCVSASAIVQRYSHRSARKRLKCTRPI
ncbi:hypothetical protein BD414DRAFT_88820 [Trametes punicea]|nr:hypothetical protein BD414DRAFT_88820 [Trametes punicea]